MLKKDNRSRIYFSGLLIALFLAALASWSPTTLAFPSGSGDYGNYVDYSPINPKISSFYAFQGDVQDNYTAFGVCDYRSYPVYIQIYVNGINTAQAICRQLTGGESGSVSWSDPSLGIWSAEVPLNGQRALHFEEFVMNGSLPVIIRTQSFNLGDTPRLISLSEGDNITMDCGSSLAESTSRFIVGKRIPGSNPARFHVSAYPNSFFTRFTIRNGEAGVDGHTIAEYTYGDFVPLKSNMSSVSVSKKGYLELNYTIFLQGLQKYGVDTAERDYATYSGGHCDAGIRGHTGDCYGLKGEGICYAAVIPAGQ